MSGKFDIAPSIAHPFVYLAIILYHSRRHIPIYSAKFSKNKTCLYLHIGTGIMEWTRYHISKAWLGHEDILPQPIDVLSCFIWSWTTLVLVKTLRRGDPLTTRPPYQAGAVMRPLVSIASYLLRVPSLHKVSISALDGFLYARLAIFFFVYTPYLRGYSDSTFYSIAIPFAAAFSIHESRVPGAALAFIIVIAYTAKLNEWVSHRTKVLQATEARSRMDVVERYFISVMLSLGFAELDTLREVSGNDALMKPINDEYVAKLESHSRS